MPRRSQTIPASGLYCHGAAYIKLRARRLIFLLLFVNPSEARHLLLSPLAPR
jgi:hypothetical protein